MTRKSPPDDDKIYYTNADLANAGITEDKLDGIYFFSAVSGVWERYSDSGAETADLVSSGLSFAGYIWANVNHLTPIVTGSDTTAPVVPASVSTLTGNSTLSLSWSAVASASGYSIRWRPTTETNMGGYTYATTIHTSYQIFGLNNDWSYEVGVATTDAHGNVSDYTFVTASPVVAVAGISTEEAKSTPAVVFASTSETPESTPPTQPSFKETTVMTPQQTPSDDEGAIKGTETTQGNGSQTVVVFAILLLALAAGVGGYYGYEWFIQRTNPDGGPF